MPRLALWGRSGLAEGSTSNPWRGLHPIIKPGYYPHSSPPPLLPPAHAHTQNFYTDARFSPPRASTYNALLKGLASGLRLAPLGGAFPAAALAGDEDGLDADEEAAAAGGRRLVLDGDSLDKLLVVLREEMVARGLRPGK